MRGMPHEQLVQQLFEAEALLHDEHLDITVTNRKRRAAAERKGKKEKNDKMEKKEM